jgi:hypothetical protein
MSGEMSAITIIVEPVETSAERSPGQAAGRDSVGVGLLVDPRTLEGGAPDLIEPVVGFRNWRIFRNGPRDRELSSPYLPVSWTERIHRAECRRRRSAEELLQEPHRAPNPGCGCGISAYHAPTGQFSKIDFRAVSGIVTVWGAIQVDGDEMRAEVARVEALALYHRWSRDQLEAVRAVAGRLGTDLVDLRELGAAAKRYGQGLPPSLLAKDRPTNFRDRFAAVFASRVGD